MSINRRGLFTFLGAAAAVPATVVLGKESKVEIKGCSIPGNGGISIYADHVNVEGCHIEGAEVGISIHDSHARFENKGER